MQTVYYLKGHALEALLEPLKSYYELIPVEENCAHLLARAVIAASAARLRSNDFVKNPTSCRLLIAYGRKSDLAKLSPEVAGAAHAYISRRSDPASICKQIENALDYIRLQEVAESSRRRLEKQSQITEELNRVGMALSSERNVGKLLEMIVCKSREITNSDAASLYLIETDEFGNQRMRFKFSRNMSIDLDLEEFTMPLSFQSMAGFVAETGIPLAIDDVYKMPIEAPYGFNQSFDEATGYRTKSMLVVPMIDAFNCVIGVLQLINHKSDPTAKLDSREAAEQWVIPYPQDLVNVALSIGSQAAVALENSILYNNIKNLFKGFVKASVTAIEQRDPTTSGHSFRVADLTVGLAESVDKAAGNPFGSINFSRNQMTEIRYASLLHDFGKVGVREEVLVKAKKLYPLQLDLLRSRFDLYRRAIQLGYSKRKLEYIIKKGSDEYFAALPRLNAEMEAELNEAQEMFDVVMKSNEPTVLAESSFERLLSITQKSFETFDGQRKPLLNEQEMKTLSIPRGSLTELERREIESHAYHTFIFLSKIPWTEEWKNIPRIAGAHHEKLDGTGYPKGMNAKDIPIQSKMMSIADVFDALTASDRPYKKAVPVEKALDIIRFEVKQGYLDSNLFNLFLASKIYERVLKS